MAWGKKPWQGSSNNASKQARRDMARDMNYRSMNITSQYQSKRETANTAKGFLLLSAFMIGTILLIHWIAVTFGH